MFIRPFATSTIVLLALALLPPAGIGATAPHVSEQGTVRGCVTLAGHSAYRGVAALWPVTQGMGPDPRQAIRPPASSTSLDAEGCFSLRAAPGEYFVGAVVRGTDGGWQGPPRPGDMVFLSPDAEGKNLTVTIHPGAAVDIGRHASGWEYSGFTPTASPLAISGRLTDPAGKPLPGLLVFAFTDSTMSKEPFAVSEPSDNNGRYLLRLPGPAIVYLRAREHYGRGSPASGGYMGVYGGEAATPVTVATRGADETRDLTVFLVPPLEMRQKKLTE